MREVREEGGGRGRLGERERKTKRGESRESDHTREGVEKSACRKRAAALAETIPWEEIVKRSHHRKRDDSTSTSARRNQISREIYSR